MRRRRAKRGEGEDQNRRHQGARPTQTIRDYAKQDAADAGHHECDRAEQARHRVVDVEIGSQLADGHGVEHEVHRVEHPASFGGGEHAPLVCGDRAYPRYGSHRALDENAGRGRMNRAETITLAVGLRKGVFFFHVIPHAMIFSARLLISHPAGLPFMADTVVAAADRTLPHNLEAERSVLGAILVHNDAFNQAVQVIDAGDFYRDAHRRIFDKMVVLNERHQAIDFVTLKEELSRGGDLDDVGGPAYVASLADGVPGPPTSSTTHGSSRKNRRCGI